MIDKTLSSMFKIVTEEAVNNPAFGKKLEDVVAKFGQELAERRLAERSIEGFHPFIEFRKGTPEEFEARLRSSMRKSCVCWCRSITSIPLTC